METILITGSSRGIGAATAKLAFKSGMNVILHGRTQSEALLGLAEELQSDFIVCDAGDENSIKTSIANLFKRIESVEGLINCVGTWSPVQFLEATSENWLESLRINLLGPVFFCQAIIPHMQRQGYGRIVNVISTRALTHMANKRGVIYSAAKAALLNFTVALAKDCAPNIAVNAVSPGYTLTDISKEWTKFSWAKANSTLLQRPAEPQEIAEAILFLASRKASFITGQHLIVDGGQTVTEWEVKE